MTTSRRCSTKCASVSLRSSTAGRPLTIDEVDDAERRLQIGQPIELVEDDLREDVLLQLDDEAHAVAIALVAHLADAFDPLLAACSSPICVRGCALFTWYGISVTTICSRSPLPGVFSTSMRARMMMLPRPVR